MIEKIVKDYLKEKLDIGCYLEKPQDDKPFLVIEKTGSGEEDGLFSATIVVQSYADSLYKSSELNEIVKTAMYDITDLDEISECRLNSDYNFTDTETKEYRYQAVFDLIHY